MDKPRLTQQHPLYTTLASTWRLLLDVYEGTGGFLDGSYLIPHPREVEYAFSEDPVTKVRTFDYNTVRQETTRFKKRKVLARYENFAQIILDTLLDYLYAKAPSRVIGGQATAEDGHPLMQWWEDVDGEGTHITDWVKRTHTLAALMGHAFVAMDRPPLDVAPRSKADQAAPFLRVYTPLDALDWIARGRSLRAVKFIEAVGRDDLNEAPLAAVSTTPTASATGDGARKSVQYRIWDGETWQVYDQDGGLLGRGDHGMGELPVLVFTGRPRATLPIVGRSVLGDPRLFRDHFNLVSEKRSLERDQTFSLLNIELGTDQLAEEAKSLAGETVSTSSALFTRGPAKFIAPEAGPVEHYERELQNLVRTIYRLVGLPWDVDSKQVETAELRKLKAMDLDRLLAGMAAEAERVEYAIARQWFIAQDGPERGQAAYEASELSIEYPTEFQTSEILDEILELRAKLSANLGPTASRILRERAVPVLLPDLTADQLATVTEEIGTTPVNTPDAASQFRGDMLKAMAEQRPGEPIPGDLMNPSERGGPA